jgi:vacuolar-type H+-ATPase subunit H
MKKIEELDKQQRNALVKGDNEKYRQLRDKEMELWKKKERIDNEFNEKWKSIREKIIKNIQEEIIGREAVIFKVKIPVNVFKELAGSDYTRNRIKDFENVWNEYVKNPTIERNWFTFVEQEGYNKFDWFEEVHLKNVDPKYIVSYEKITKEI